MPKRVAKKKLKVKVKVKQKQKQTQIVNVNITGRARRPQAKKALGRGASARVEQPVQQIFRVTEPNYPVPRYQEPMQQPAAVAVPAEPIRFQMPAAEQQAVRPVPAPRVRIPVEPIRFQMPVEPAAIPIPEQAIRPIKVEPVQQEVIVRAEPAKYIAPEPLIFRNHPDDGRKQIYNKDTSRYNNVDGVGGKKIINKYGKQD